jgi:universal stress protein E
VIMEPTNIFVVYDPTRESQPALERAVAIAATTPVQVHIFCCVYADIAKSEARPAQVKALLAQQKEEISRETAPLLAQDTQVNIEVEWDKNWYQAAVRASVRNCADVVLKSTFKHTQGQRILNRTSDWTLIRECLCPVLLVKEGSPRDIRKVLAAIDIRKDNDNYEALNRHIIDFSRRVIDNNDAEVHFVNAFEELQAYPDRNALIRYCGVDSDKIHIQLGDPDDVIVNSANDLNASLVVVGNSARSGLSAVIRGNTVEKVLDKLECDLLSMP